MPSISLDDFHGNRCTIYLRLVLHAIHYEIYRYISRKLRFDMMVSLRNFAFKHTFGNQSYMYDVCLFPNFWLNKCQCNVLLRVQLTTTHDSDHDDVIKWKHFPRYWSFVRGIHRSPVNTPHKGQWCGAVMFSLICAWINGWVNNREAGDLRRHRAHYDVIVMTSFALNRRQTIFRTNE